MTYKCVMGVDPGITGALSFYFPSHPMLVGIHDMPIDGKTVDGYEIAKIIRQYNPDVAFIEAVHSFSGQGVTSSFNFGCSYGVVRGVVAACSVPTILVSPQKWKRALDLSKDKNQSLEMARMMWPESDKFKRRKDDGRAEAALIAIYGYKSQFDVKEN
jgi:Holliday junction resolvasome RuvABC endonuclease subunit